GPLRSSGYASIPPAVGNAPRFRSIVQFVWAGLRDDESFGTDPVFAVLRQQDPDDRMSQASGAIGAPRLQTRRIAHGTDSHPDGIDASSIGEMELFSRQKVSDSLRKAVLICTDRAHGALYSWNAGVIIAGPAEVDGTAVRRTIAADL